MLRLLIVYVLSLAAVASETEKRPQLTWQGYVSGVANVFIQANRVDAQGRQTGAVDKPSFRFSSPLPAVQQTVSVQTRRGHGRVVMEEQPTRDNDFTAVIRIEPRQKPELYILEVFWQPADPAQTK